jgi:hypothetical protein
MSYSSDNLEPMYKLLIILVTFALSALINGFFLEYSIETIGKMLGKEVDFPYYMCVLISIIPHITRISIPIAVLTFIATFFVL